MMIKALAEDEFCKDGFLNAFRRQDTEDTDDKQDSNECMTTEMRDMDGAKATTPPWW